MGDEIASVSSAMVDGYSDGNDDDNDHGDSIVNISIQN